MQIIYVIGGVSPEYAGWLQIKAMNTDLNLRLNSDQLRSLVIKYVNQYMQPAGQKYHLYWAEVASEPLDQIYDSLKTRQIPRYKKSAWFNTDVWTVRKVLGNDHDLTTNVRQLKPLSFATYLYGKYQKELQLILNQHHNSKEQRFKRDFFNTWQLSSIDSNEIHRVAQMFSAYLLLRNVVNTVPKGCRKMYRKLVPLRMDDLDYDLKLLDYKCHLNQIIEIRNRINALRDRPFGTAEFTDQYLNRHVRFLRIFDKTFLKRYFNL